MAPGGVPPRALRKQATDCRSSPRRTGRVPVLARPLDGTHLAPPSIREITAMFDRSLDGTRCLTKRPITHHTGYVPPRMEGTIRYTVENIGRTLIRVDLDSGASILLLPDD